MSLFDSEPASMAFISQHHFFFSFYTSTTVRVQSTGVDGEKQEGVDILGSQGLKRWILHACIVFYSILDTLLRLLRQLSPLQVQTVRTV